MKKIIGLAIGVVAMVALSGCNVTGNPGNNPSTPTGTSYQEVDILDLSKGYLISGYDDWNSRSVKYCFYGNEYWYDREGEELVEGRFKIGDGEYYTNTRINLFWSENGQKASARIDTEGVVNAEGGKIVKGYTYELYNQKEEIRVEQILKTESCYN